MPNASIEVMINCFLAQSSDDWALTVVSDGPDDRASAVVGRYGSTASEAVRFLHTDRAYADHGHTPRELGLHSFDSPWTVLSGVDNYYVPLFVETVTAAIAARPDVGLIYYDFLLDMKVRSPKSPGALTNPTQLARPTTHPPRDGAGRTRGGRGI